MSDTPPGSAAMTAMSDQSCSCTSAVVDAICPVHGYSIADLLRCADGYRWEADDA